MIAFLLLLQLAGKLDGASPLPAGAVTASPILISAAGSRFSRRVMTEKPFSGPNVCAHRWGINICCRGWSKNVKSQCLIASCDGHCGDKGKCVRPDVCRCHDNVERTECQTFELTGVDNDSLISSNASLPGRPNNNNGYQSDDPGSGFSTAWKPGQLRMPENIKVLPDDKKGRCYLSLERGICRRKLSLSNDAAGDDADSDDSDSTLLTMLECCNSFGRAWSHENKCESCENLLQRLSTPHCTTGYKQRGPNNACVDIDECELGACKHGQCRNKEGSYHCQCPYSMIYNETVLACEHKKTPCEIHGDACTMNNGFCRNLLTNSQFDYECVCGEGYEPAENKRKCVPIVEEAVPSLTTFNMCDLYKDKVCQNGRCVSGPGLQYECRCNDGFRESKDKRACIAKVNLCKLNFGSLCRNGQCIPLLDSNSYECRCNPGFQLAFHKKSCIGGSLLNRFI